MVTDSLDITPREIEIFAAVMLHGTTTKAADALDITQPAVSKTLVQLTEKAGFQLFRKNRQRLVPTPEAHMLYAEVKQIFELVRGISRAVREIREMQSGRLNICALPAFGLTLLPSIISSFSRMHPSMDLARHPQLGDGHSTGEPQPAGHRDRCGVARRDAVRRSPRADLYSACLHDAGRT